MGSRTLPYDCEHGVTVDWGDFGPCGGDCETVHPDNLLNCPDYPVCDECETAYPRRRFVIELSVCDEMLESTTDALLAVADLVDPGNVTMSMGPAIDD